MKDFNFFAPFTGGKKDLEKEYLYATIISCGLVLLSLLTYTFNYFNINELNSEIVAIKQNLNSKENIIKLKEIENEDKKLVIMNQYYVKVVDIGNNINNKRLIGSKVIDKINSCVPKGVYFKVMNLGSSGVQLEAEGNDKEQAAVFERALRNLDIVKEVHIDSINSSPTENKNFTFTVNCTLKDVDNNENN